MNRVILVGRLTRDPEIRHSVDNKATARFSLAVDRRYKKRVSRQLTSLIVLHLKKLQSF